MLAFCRSAAIIVIWFASTDVTWADSKWFRIIIRLVIFANFVTVVLFSALEVDNTLVLNAVDVLFLAIYSVEAVLKLVYFGGRGYFLLRWNVFDFVLVVFGWLSFILDETLATGAGIVIMVCTWIYIHCLWGMYVASAANLRWYPPPQTKPTQIHSY